MSRFIITRNSIDGSYFKGKNINLLCLFYLLLWTLVPAFSAITNHGIFRVLFAVILIAWILTAIQNIPRYVALKLTIQFGLFGFVLVLYSVIGYGDLGFYDIVNYLLLFGFSLNGVLYNKLNSKKLDSMIVMYSLTLLLLTTVTTMMALQMNPNAARLLTSSQTDQGASIVLRSQNVGAFDFIYGLVIVFPVLVSMLKSKLSKNLKIYCGMLAVVISICVIKSNFTTALLLLFVGFWLPGVFNNSKNMNLKLCTIILIVILVPLLLPCFLRSVYRSTSSILAREKIEGLLLYMNGIGQAEDVSSRVSLFKMSFSSFLKKPLYGVGGYYRTISVANVGKHAQFVDDLARYGILGGAPLLLFVFYSIKNCTTKSKITRSSFFSSIVIFLFLGFMNPIYNYGILTCFFVVSSTLSRYVDRGDK